MKIKKNLPLLFSIVVLILSHILHQGRLIEQSISNITTMDLLPIAKFHYRNLHFGNGLICKLVDTCCLELKCNQGQGPYANLIPEYMLDSVA